MANLPDGWVFVPKMKDILTVTVEQKELVCCRHCKHWIPGAIDETDNFIEPRCEWNGGGWSSNDYCSYAERVEANGDVYSA